jgi:hypothetical protein
MLKKLLAATFSERRVLRGSVGTARFAGGTCSEPVPVLAG